MLYASGSEHVKLQSSLLYSHDDITAYGKCNICYPKIEIQFQMTRLEVLLISQDAQARSSMLFHKLEQFQPTTLVCASYFH
jgi:hypothetical protein